MPIAIRPLTPADYPRMIEIQKDQLPVAQTVADLQRADEVAVDHIRHSTAAVTADGLLVGYAVADRSPVAPPGRFQANIRVVRAWRGQGVGSALQEEQERALRDLGATTIEVSVREEAPEGMTFAQHRGYTLKWHRYASKLDLSRFDPKPWRDAVLRAEASGIRFTSLGAYPQTDETLEQFLESYWQMHQGSPDMDGGTRPTLEMAKRQLPYMPGWDPNGVILAVDGERWVGLAWVSKRPDGSFYHNFTGVMPAARGRGLATALKVVALEYAIAQGATVIHTHNNSLNERMLAVNRKLGYAPEPGVYVLHKQL